MNTPEQNNFTLLRLILALLVVLGHFVILPAGKPASGIFGYANFAVDTFFVVSGYLIYASFDNQPVIGKFYIRRLFRIYPLYMTVILAQALIMAVLAGGIRENANELLRYLGLNLMMANFLAHDIGGLLSGLHNPGINPSLWTLKIEFAFYLLLPLLWFLIQRFGLWFMVLLYIASSIYVAITLHYGLDNFAKQLPGQMRFFIAGMALYRYRAWLTFPTWIGIIAACGLFLICKYFSGSSLIIPLYPICAGLIMYICVFRLPIIALPFDISYGVYLLHGPLIQLSLLLGIFMDTPGFLLLLLSTVFLLALLAERIIEQPCIELGKRLARNWTARFGNANAA
jgi:peptidoglycan/LPS O-acetylase OafA/YrhL